MGMNTSFMGMNAYFMGTNAFFMGMRGTNAYFMGMHGNECLFHGNECLFHGNTSFEMKNPTIGRLWDSMWIRHGNKEISKKRSLRKIQQNTKTPKRKKQIPNDWYVCLIS